MLWHLLSHKVVSSIRTKMVTVNLAYKHASQCGDTQAATGNLVDVSICERNEHLDIPTNWILPPFTEQSVHRCKAPRLSQSS